MNEQLLKKIERNTARTAKNSAFITWVVIINLFAAVGIGLIMFG
jgi:hypothetical protein